MAKRVTMRDIAKELDISTVSVSKALSGKEGVSREVRDRIKSKADEMGYRYNAASKGFIDDKSYNIGILIAKRFVEDDSAFYSKLYNNMIIKLGEKNYFGIMEILSKEDERACTLPNMITNHKVDGIIILGQLKNRYIDSIKEAEIPYIFLDFYDEHSQVDSIVSDSVYGSYLLTNYLIDNGHKKIGFIGDVFATSSILDRYLGYYKSLLQHEIQLREDWVIKDRDENGQLFSEYTFPMEMPEAFVCNCDEVAYIVVEALKKIGYRVPEDISVVGYDDYIYATLCKPQLTTFAVDLEVMAAMAVEAILRSIRGEDCSPGRKVISGSLVIRNSVMERN